MNLRPTLLAALLSGTIFGAEAAQALTVTLQATDRGWYDDAGRHLANNRAYITGNNFGDFYNSFFLFDLSQVDGQAILGAQLKFGRGTSNIAQPGGSTGFETPGVYDVTTSLADVVAGGTGLTAIYADLGAGSLLGQADLFPSSNPIDDFTFDLNAAGLAALNAVTGSVVLGGTLLSLDPQNSFDEYLFGGTGRPGNPERPTLTLTVTPIPTALPLLAAGLAGLGALSRRRRG